MQPGQEYQSGPLQTQGKVTGHLGSTPFDRAIGHFEEKGVIVCLSGMTVLYSLSMVARYITRFPVSWADELVGFLFIWAIFLGASIGAKRGAHLGVAALQDALPVKWQRRVLFFITACCVFTCCVLVWAGVKMVRIQFSMGQQSSQIGLPVGLVGLSVPVGLSLCAVRFVQAFLRKLGQPKQ
jgi:C4-dicarboxylate transporter DctQ subunit